MFQNKVGLVCEESNKFCLFNKFDLENKMITSVSDKLSWSSNTFFYMVLLQLQSQIICLLDFSNN